MRTVAAAVGFASLLLTLTQPLFADPIQSGTATYALEGSISGLPYPVGTEFFGTAASEAPIHVQTGATPEPSVDPQIGLALSDGYVRITRVVPKPTAALLIASAVAAACVVRTRGTR